MIASGRLLQSWPTNPDRAALQRSLLEHRRVEGLVRGREPVPRDELIAMVSQQYGVSIGMAQASLERAEAAQHVRVWVTLPDGPRPVPGADSLLQDLEAGAEALEAQRAAPKE